VVKRWSVVAAVLLALVAAGCRAESSVPSQEASESRGPGTTETAQPAGATFGDLEVPCGEGDASGATDQGVTDSAIEVGTMSDASSTVQPGLNQEIWDASEAFVAWCNELGGINGRQIEYTAVEPKILEATQATIAACDTEFMLVGGGAAFDNDVARERVACGLPDVPAYNATKAATEAELSYPPLPTPFDELPVGEAFYLAEQHPEAVAKAGMLAPNFPSAVNIATRAKVGYEAAGWTFVDEQLYNPAGEANWTGIVSGFKSSGVDALLYAGTMEPLAAFLQASAEQDYKPTILIGTSTIFTPDLITEAGPAAEGTYAYTSVRPFDDPAEGSATAAYIELLDTYADGAEPALLGANSMSAWLLWATAAKACGSDLTRACVGEKITEISEWTAGGLHAASNPSAGTSPSCFVLLQVKDGVWTSVHPESDFDCDPSYTVPTPADYT
jgi:ABC-type branched-subunit amino acid transport system substrate-binding protein